MPIHTRLFGHLQDGRPVNAIRLQHPHSGFAVELLEYGATLRTVEVPLVQRGVINAVLAYDTLAEYEADQAYVGVIVGRCANRIANSTANLNGEHLKLTSNEGPHHLHGGARGLGKALWRVADMSDGTMPTVRLMHHSPDGEEGYPGELSVQMEVKITAALSFSVSITASSTRQTPFNPTLHSYFNLNGFNLDETSSIDTHELFIDADAFLQTTDAGIPTGERLTVSSTPFDFREYACVGARRAATHPQLQARGGFDHYFVFNKRAACDVQLRCRELTLQVHTNQPGVQFYDGGQLHRNSARFQDRAGLCIEPHSFPNAVNEPGFPSIILSPHDLYRHVTQFTFVHAGSDLGA